MTPANQKPTDLKAVGLRLRILREALGITLGDIFNKLKLIQGSKKTQLDRIERLVTLLQQHRGELMLEEKPTAGVFSPTIPEGATHYEDSLHSYDGTVCFYRITETDCFYEWGRIYKSDALGWTICNSHRSELRLTKLP